MSKKEMIQKAISVIENIKIEKQKEIGDPFDTAIDALIKEKPLSPLPPKLGVDGSKIIRCSCCGKELEEIYVYCPWCGRKIKWSKDKEKEN